MSFLPQIQPTISAEQAETCQDWKGMDGACAYHLIERHAENWADIGLMMEAWLRANGGDNKAPHPTDSA